jgi:hypothetical protein
MKSIDEIDRLLGQTPAPSLAESPHREQLKRQLLEKPQPLLPKRKRMWVSVFTGMSPMTRTIVVLLAAAMLVGTGWAAEKIFEKLTKVVVDLEDSGKSELKYSLTLPDGTTQNFTSTHSDSTTVSVPNDPVERQIAIEAAKKQREEMKILIAEKKYEFVKESKYPSGETSYTYKFKLDDGKEFQDDFWVRLETVTSWDEYLQKEKETRIQCQNEIGKAIKAGRFRLIDLFTYQIQLCRDVKTGHKISVLRIDCDDGRVIAFLTYSDNGELVKEEESWHDHLKALRDGKRELLGLDDLGKEYKYEVILDDGSKVIYGFGSDKPLTKLVDPEDWHDKNLSRE